MAGRPVAVVTGASAGVGRAVALAFRYGDAGGRWFNDGSADGECANEWGGMNSVVQT